MDILYDTFSIYSTAVITYISCSILSYFIDTNQFFAENKIKNRTKQEYQALYLKCIPNVSKNILLYIFPYIFILLYTQKQIYGDYQIYDYDYKILNLLKLSFNGILIYIITDIVFYHTHRLMHTKYLYNYHKTHHEFKNPISISALYMHPLDLYVSNLSPIAIASILLNLDIFSNKLNIIIQISYTILVSHNGYKQRNIHNIHHTLFKYNFGLTGHKTSMDTLYDTEFKEPLIKIIDQKKHK